MERRRSTTLVRGAVAAVVVLVGLIGVWFVDGGRAAAPAKPSGLVLYEVSTCDCSGDEEFWTESLWTVDVRTGQRRHLTPRTGGHDAAWSPDGTRIAYVSEDFDLWLMNADGSGKQRLTRGPFITSPTWSPDGRGIAFGSDLSGPGDELVVVTSGGGRRRTLGREPAGFGEVAWSPNGATIAYDTPGFGKEAISVVGADGKHRRRLAAGRGPTWSPDGRWISFTAGSGASQEVGLVRPDGTGGRALTTSPALDRDPAWSADGHRISFVSDRSGETRIYLMRSDGRGQRRVTRDTGTGDTSNWSEENPAWAPTGGWIAYTISSLYKREGIHVVNADGTGQRQLVSANAHDPLWRPNPRKRP